eukprot:GHVN01001914.1.p1 GENE.GHVN01001914.1~~GHVN01001914.1.p1  ORF type:complete len:506 (+),score=26.51 GHVN01001914.1:840-2357(+)
MSSIQSLCSLMGIRHRGGVLPEIVQEVCIKLRETYTIDPRYDLSWTLFKFGAEPERTMQEHFHALHRPGSNFYDRHDLYQIVESFLEQDYRNRQLQYQLDNYFPASNQGGESIEIEAVSCTESGYGCEAFVQRTYTATYTKIQPKKFMVYNFERKLATIPPFPNVVNHVGEPTTRGKIFVEHGMRLSTFFVSPNWMIVCFQPIEEAVEKFHLKVYSYGCGELIERSSLIAQRHAELCAWNSSKDIVAVYNISDTGIGEIQFFSIDRNGIISSRCCFKPVLLDDTWTKLSSMEFISPEGKQLALFEKRKMRVVNLETNEFVRVPAGWWPTDEGFRHVLSSPNGDCFLVFCVIDGTVDCSANGCTVFADGRENPLISEGVVCDQGHFTCFGCFTKYVTNEINQRSMVDQRRKEYVEALKTKDKKKVEALFGHIHCPMDGCHSSPFNDSLWLENGVTADTVQKWSDVRWKMKHEERRNSKDEGSWTRKRGSRKRGQAKQGVSATRIQK